MAGWVGCGHTLMTHVTVSLYICQSCQELSGYYYYCPQKQHRRSMALTEDGLLFFFLPDQIYEDAFKSYCSHSLP